MKQTNQSVPAFLRSGLAAGVAAACTLAALSGCESLGKGSASSQEKPAKQEPVVLPPLPAYGDLARAHNARIQGLERIKAPVSLVIKSTDAAGKQSTDQVEGNLTIALPRSLSLRLDKIGQTVFVMGSNEDRFWWFDLREPATSYVASHRGASHSALADFDLPIHPLDLIVLLGISPLPEQSGTSAWSKDGSKLGLFLPIDGGAGGQLRVWLDPKTREPVRCEVFDSSKRFVLVANPTRYAAVTLKDGPVAGGPTQPRMATRFEIKLLARQTVATLNLVSPENPGSKLKQKVFDYAALKENYSVAKEVSLDTKPDTSTNASQPDNPVETE